MMEHIIFWLFYVICLYTCLFIAGVIYLRVKGRYELDFSVSSTSAYSVLAGSGIQCGDLVFGSELALSVVVMSSAQQGVSTQSQTITEGGITAAQEPFILHSIIYLVWSQVDEIVSRCT